MQALEHGNHTRALPPVLVLAFNRPDTTRRVIESLRPVRPGRLFFAVDGPRESRNEGQQVEEVQSLAGSIDWDCEVSTLFRESNLGCKHAVSQAITWFFDRVDAGIILEDDCIAHPSFFPYAAELLERYEEDRRVFMISGNNFQFGQHRTDDSYYFSRHTHIWGWATWRRAWLLFDFEMRRWPELRVGGWLQEMLGDRSAVDYWTRVFDETHSGRNSSWAYRWTFAAWTNNALTVLPAVNLVSNIGFGSTGTHNWRRSNRFASLPAGEMVFPLRHPNSVVRCASADDFTQRTMFSASIWRRLARTAYIRWIRRDA